MKEAQQKQYAPVMQVDDLSPEEFCDRFETPKIPVIIKNHRLDWRAFETWNRRTITERLTNDKHDLTLFRKYLRWFPKSVYRDSPIQYLTNVPFEEYPELQADYDIPVFFADAAYQPKKYQWLFLGPPSSSTQVHQDVEFSHAWNVSIYGRKYWWFFEEDSNRVLTGNSEPGDIVFTPGGMFHAVVNLEECLSVTHNYKRSLPED